MVVTIEEKPDRMKRLVHCLALALTLILMVAGLVLPVYAEDSPTEIIGLRSENSKTFDVGNGKRRLEVSIGAIHYKDDYANASEQWKDIDLTWVDNKITKAPYELTLESNKVTIRDKKTGEISTIELLEIGAKGIPAKAWEKSKGLAKAPGIVNLDNIALDTDLEIVAENTRVSFTRVLKSDKAPVDAMFKITGKWTARAEDATEGINNQLPVETVLAGGILTETLKPDRVVKYPVRIDPTWQVTASTDDVEVEYVTPIFNLTSAKWNVGYYYTYSDLGSAGRFLNVTIPPGSTITQANLKVVANGDYIFDTVNTRLRAQSNINPATFSTIGDFNARTWTSDATHVHWDAIPHFAAETEYTSPDIKAIIQEVIDLPSWASGNPIVIEWDDWERRSTQDGTTWRAVYSLDGSTTKVSKLVVTYIVNPPTVTSQAATLVEETTATWNGDITSTGGEDADYRGFVWGTTSKADPGDVAPAVSGYDSLWYQSGAYGVGAFTYDVITLTVGTTWYYRATAHNVYGWDYSNTEQAVYTKPGDPSALTALTISTVQIDLAWTKGTGAEKTKVIRKLGSYPANIADGFEVYFDTLALASDTGLSQGLAYFYGVWAWDTNSGYSDGCSQAQATTLLGVLHLALWYQPNAIISGATLPDRAGANTGTINWGTNPGGVTVTIGSMTPSGTSVTTTTTRDPRDLLPPGMTTDMFGDSTVAGLATHPLRPFVTMLSDNTTLSELQAWRWLGMMLALAVMATTLRALRGHWGIAAISVTVVLIALVATDRNVYPWWLLLFAVGFFVAGLIIERSPNL